ncbi:MAG: 2-oxoacid:acceptor oxidoreductase family protein [Proteobacteria bacterium]|nr:2-oxoacid:acceptor oxidoreductase family protein [Pseudomonadota bacterium]
MSAKSSTAETAKEDNTKVSSSKPKYPGTRTTTNGNQLVSYYTEARLAEAGIFYPITPSTEMGELFQLSFAQGELNVFGDAKIAIEAEGEHSAQGGAIAMSLIGKRVVNFTSGQGILYGIEQYYHAPGKLSTMVLEVSARALTKHALNVHCGHEDVYATLDTGWIVLYSKDAQQASDQALILRRATELSLTPGINAQDGFLTSHLERTFLVPEAELIREFLGRADDIIECPTKEQKVLFGPTRRRIPECFDLKSPAILGPVENQEHYMQGVSARRYAFVEHILGFLEESYEDFGKLTGRNHGLISEYNTEGADTVFVALGSAAENVEAASDYLKEKKGENAGVIHVNVLRPFPEKAIVKALGKRKNIIVLERGDDQLATENVLARDIRSALYRAFEKDELSSLPKIYNGVYGLGSRDFRPENIFGAWEFVTGGRARQDGRKAADGETLFYLGIDHPYAVNSEDTQSLLPEDAIATRFHSIGGWGAITTGKNLGEIFGQLSDYIAKRDGCVDADTGAIEEVLHVSANPKYGSEKKGAPTNYFLVVAPERIRVNCDLRHVNVVLCCDPKAFTHTNPLQGLTENGILVWESSETDDAKVWERIPERYRQFILDKNIKIYVLNGFNIAAEATDREDLQFRMQGNSLLGAFFAVSTFLKDNKIPDEEFLGMVRKQYEHKFGRFGEAVVESNMKVMSAGFSQVREIPHGDVSAPDTSTMRGDVMLPQRVEKPADVERIPMHQRKTFDDEFRSGKGYDQAATPFMATGIIAAGTGGTASKYVSRRMVPKFIPENCTQCMACINACPDTALPNTAQDISTILIKATQNYVDNEEARKRLLSATVTVSDAMRQQMLDESAKKEGAVKSVGEIAREQFEAWAGKDDWFSSEKTQGKEALDQLFHIIDVLPLAYNNTKMIFGSKEKKEPGSGGLFSIFVSDLCKGCGECVVECGDHNALEMVGETPEINGRHLTAEAFIKLLPDTPQKYLGLFDAKSPMESKAAALQNHFMVQSNYQALLSGDGACAGCGEKTILRSITSLTEAYMRPLYHAKADRLSALADEMEKEGLSRLEKLKGEKAESYNYLRDTILHAIMGFGGENDKDTRERIEAKFEGDDAIIVDALVTILRQDAYNHKDLQVIDGHAFNGMCTMAMTANTGCNTVYGSTPPNTPHPYPWMNFLFQDGATVAWLVGEGFMINHATRSVIPERLSRAIMSDGSQDFSHTDYFRYTHFSDAYMTSQEIRELPKVWAVGGDGALGDIGYQNCSKVILQNRPNVKILMLDTQVYSNTGGQNSDSSVMPGGFDMNQYGDASEGKLTEKKGVAETFFSGHGSAFLAQVSMANSTNLFRAILDAIDYRGTAFIQAYTTCQPEHGVGDAMSTIQAQLSRDSRGLPEFVYNPAGGESMPETLSLKGNPSLSNDWYVKTVKPSKTRYNYTVAHWATTEARFRRHFFKVKAEDADKLIHLDDMLARITQHDVNRRLFLDPGHRSFVPEKGVYIEVEQPDGTSRKHGISRQMVLFCVERRKSWRMMQSLAGISNPDYEVQKLLVKEYEEGKISHADMTGKTSDLIEKIKSVQSRKV